MLSFSELKFCWGYLKLGTHFAFQEKKTGLLPVFLSDLVGKPWIQGQASRTFTAAFLTTVSNAGERSIIFSRSCSKRVPETKKPQAIVQFFMLGEASFSSFIRSDDFIFSRKILLGFLWLFSRRN